MLRVTSVNRIVVGLILMAAAFGVHAPARAAELVTAFDQAITVNRDGSMQVVETISANAEGKIISHGIFRDFPLSFADGSGHSVKTDVSISSVERDGKLEDWHGETFGNTQRIYVGRSDQTVSRGMHVYRITYTADGGISEFDDRDELYWNVTGNGWSLPIRHASASVSLPEGVVPQQIAVFTGPSGATGKNATIVQKDGRLTFATTRPLAKGEGLTISARLPKGAFAPADDSGGISVAAFGLFVVLLYNVVASRRSKAGSDRVREPRCDPPENISPAVANYIDNKGFPRGVGTALSAAVLNLAVKGYVILDPLEDRLLVHAADRPLGNDLDNSEMVVLSAISPRAPLAFDKKNALVVKAVADEFRRVIERDHENRYFLTKNPRAGGSLLLALAALGAICLKGSGGLALVIVVGLATALIGGMIVALRHRRTSRLGRFAAGFCLTLIAACFVGIVVAASSNADKIRVEGLVMATLIAAIVAVTIFFASRFQTWTKLGAEVFNQIDGLRTYLSAAIDSSTSREGSAAMSSQHFESLLPYAVALGAGTSWSQSFDRWVKIANKAGAAAAVSMAYSPYWCRRNGYRDGYRDAVEDMLPSRYVTNVSGIIDQSVLHAKNASPASSSATGSTGDREPDVDEASGETASGGRGFSGGGGW